MYVNTINTATKHHMSAEREDQNTADFNSAVILRKWGESFWEESEYRIKEVTKELEKQFKASLGAKCKAVDLKVEGLGKLNEEERAEIKQRAQTVINDVQVRQLTDIVDLIDEILDDPQKRYYIEIDRLDEDWVDDKLRYRLIHALIQCVRDFRKVKNAKIIVSIRLDLLERVFRLVSSAGHQEEKYRALYLPLQWSRKNLMEVLDKRINYLVRQRYTKQVVTYRDLLPKSVRKQDAVGFILDRTLMQPRDIIHFFNQCILQAEGQPVLSRAKVLAAEGEYSRLRLKYLADEWSRDYPYLKEFSRLLKKSKETFNIGEMSKTRIEEFCLIHCIENPSATDSLSRMALLVAEEGVMTAREFARKIMLIFYKVGLVGLKIESYTRYVWSISNDRTVSAAEIDEGTRAKIHPAFHRVLGVRK